MRTSIAAGAAFVLVSASTSAQDVSLPATSSTPWSALLEELRDTAPPRLVIFGNYSDGRFIDMMTPHHAMAVEMAQLALQRAEHEELRALAQNIVESQTTEIDELKSLKKNLYGTDHTPSRMNPLVMENMGMASMAELQQAGAFDCAFLDSMIPHHAAAIPMAGVVLRRSEVSELKALARDIFDAQSREVGEMQAWRAAWCDPPTAMP